MLKKLFVVLSVFVILMGLHGGIIASDGITNIVKTESGPIRGTIEEGVRVFLGIPYAAPPVGDLRWKPPQPVASWTQVKEVTAFGPACPQPRQDKWAFSEDCLYLNVWTAAKKPDVRMPVMVWIHGGGFNFGSASLREYNGKNLAKKGVVVVTINYRLGPLGFLVHPLLSRESAHKTSGNYGLLDQIAALKWVHENITAFGGDPGNVTVFGQSAGSRSVSLLMISPLAKGLFHRAIAESGGPIIGSEYLNPFFNGDMENVSKMGQKLAAKLGCEGAEDVLAAMRARSAQDIISAADCRTGLFDEGLFFAPVFDGWVLPKNPLTAYSEGRQHDVPIITGSTANEGTFYLTGEKDLTVERYKAFLAARFDGKADKVFDVFPVYKSEDVASVIDKFITVAVNAQPARFVAQSMERMKSRAYLYHFTRRPDTELAHKMGAHHGVELAYVFGNMSKFEGYNDTDMKFSEMVMGYWVNFAKTGNPNGKGLPYWPAYKSKTDINLEFSDTVRINKNLYKKECDFISGTSFYYWQSSDRNVTPKE